jgi:hypothetical protein
MLNFPVLIKIIWIKIRTINFSLLSSQHQKGIIKNEKMTTKEKFEQLKILDISSKSESKRAELDIQFELLAKEDPEGFETAVLESARKTLDDAKILRIKEQMSEISDIISMSYISKRYFNKTKSWLSQRINEHEVNGKPAKFAPEEIDTLNFALQDIAAKIGTFRISC